MSTQTKIITMPISSAEEDIEAKEEELDETIGELVDKGWTLKFVTATSSVMILIFQK